MPNIVKNTTIIGPLDLLAPHTCRGCGRLGNVLCDCCKNNIAKNHKNFCPNCKNNNQNGKCQNCKDLPPTFAVGKRSGLLDILIQDLKYHSVRASVKPLAELLNNSLPKFKGDVVIVPLPTISKHIRARGLDHTYLIAKYLAKLRNYKVQKLLLRNKDTVQVGTNRSTRLTQAETAYGINPKIKPNKNTTYILLDDVWTTGASFRAAEKKLRQSGAQKIIFSVLAVS